MRTSRRLALATLLVSVTAFVGATAGPTMADDRSGPAVITNLSPEASMEELHAKAEELRGERLPRAASLVTVVESREQLSADQIAALVTGKEADGARRLGEVGDLSPTTTLQEVGRQIGWGDVVWWECYPVYVIVGGYVYVFWVCRPLVLRA